LRCSNLEPQSSITVARADSASVPKIEAADARRLTLVHLE
jgi:hypothetical protein